MAVQGTMLPFSGQHIFVGIDVHHKSWQVAVYSERSFIKTFTQPPDVNILANYLEKTYPGADYHCAYESGFCGFWIAKELDRRGIDCIVVHAADIPRSDKQRRNKNDKVDSKTIAMQLRSGSLKKLWIPDTELLSDRGLLRERKQHKKDMIRVQNRIHALLKFHGIYIPEELLSMHWPGRFINWLEQLQFEYPSARTTLDGYLSVLKSFRQQELDIMKQLRERSKGERYRETVQLLKTIKGIGFITALTLVFELGTMDRFKRFDELASYVGLVPGEHSSGDTERNTRITSRRNDHIRDLLIEDSWIAIRHDPELQRYYNKKCHSTKQNLAIIAVAQRLLKRVRSVWIHRKPYEVVLTTDKPVALTT
jgi:transposase